ncbi:MULTISPECIES: hypothetical protein [unclassified Thioalkalivibrio]|uniref:hypothetical protein n=1 Tax=unclassified Thioalkalivibrio TaxID=2621013 RepID=UPI000369FBA4|nr:MULTISPECIES: hypothetical protein [unclassified Thioalkalivibrio]
MDDALMEAFPLNAPFTQTTAALDQCIGNLTGALLANTQPGVGLYDPVDEAPTPGDHYGQTAASLALAIQEGPDTGFWHRPLDAWEALPEDQRGHAPFNRFLLNVLAEYLEQSGASPGEVFHIRRLAQRCKLSRGYPSNNWTLLARLCELQEASGNARIRAHARLRGLFDRWVTPSGAFVDYPARPGIPERGATPTAYHHKALFVAVTAAELGESEAWQPTIERLLKWSLHVWDGHGHVGGLGRSSHALFGDACLMASLILLGASQSQAQDTPPGRMLHSILQRLQEQTRPDGFIALNPADRKTPGTGWDTYMYLSVYNAWAAAIITWAKGRTTRADRAPVPIELRALEPSVTDKPHAVPFRVGAPGKAFFLISGCGQPPQAFSRSEVELRYAGGMPLHAAWQGLPLCPAPVRISRQALEANAALAGWTPVFEAQGILFGLTDFDSCDIKRGDRIVRISLSGHPRALVRPATSGLGQHALAALDWRLLGGALGRRAALRRPKLAHIRGHLEWTIHLDQPRIEQTLNLEHRGEPGIRYLNPGGHAVTGAATSECSFLAESGHTEQGQTPTPDAWLETPLPSATAGAIGRSRPSIELPLGQYHAELIVTWTALASQVTRQPDR